MASATEIANLALAHLGTGKLITNIDTDQSQEAFACNQFYAIALEQLLADFEWPFATKIQTLALIEEDPNNEWKFSYEYPSDCVFFRKIQSGLRTDNRQSEIEYKISRDNVIWTDMEEAIGEYTSLVDDPQLYPADFIMALSYLLAFYIAPQVTRGDPYKMRDSIFKLYLMQVGRASSSSVNEESRAEEPKAEWIRGRS